MKGSHTIHTNGPDVCFLVVYIPCYICEDRLEGILEHVRIIWLILMLEFGVSGLFEIVKGGLKCNLYKMESEGKKQHNIMSKKSMAVSRITHSLPYV